MNIIFSQTKKFNSLVTQYFQKNYRLKNINIRNHQNYETPLKININSLIRIRNTILIHNKILNQHYNITTLNEDQYSIVYITYKNLTVLGNNRNCSLNIETKTKINQTYNYIKNSFGLHQNIRISNDIIVIGRKYICKDEKITNSLNFFCTYNPTENKNNQKVIKCNYNEKGNEKSNEKGNEKGNEQSNEQSNVRRKFLFHLKEKLERYNIRYISNYHLLKSSIFLDLEYINDIYDDFSSFPVSKDSSMIFMIGVCLLSKDRSNSLDFTDFTVNKLTADQEYTIVKKYLNFIIDRIHKSKDIILFHWSPADKNYVEKTIGKYPDLLEIYNIYINHIYYIDLLQIVKETIKIDSYSLKYVSKYLLNQNYDTDCQNGFDAMCSVIELNKKSDNLIKSTVMQDIINYNKLDISLLYQLLMYFTKSPSKITSIK